MSKHLADHRNPSDGSRVKRFITLEKANTTEGSHPASRSLARRKVDRTDARRVKEFLRIERGQRA